MLICHGPVEQRGHERRMAKETVLAVALPAIATWGESETERDWRRVREAWKEIKERRPQLESVSDGGRERQGSKETSMAQGKRARQRQRDASELSSGLGNERQ